MPPRYQAVLDSLAAKQHEIEAFHEQNHKSEVRYFDWVLVLGAVLQQGTACIALQNHKSEASKSAWAVMQSWGQFCTGPALDCLSAAGAPLCTPGAACPLAFPQFTGATDSY